MRTTNDPHEKEIATQSGKPALSSVSKICAIALLGNGLTFVLEYWLATTAGLSVSTILPLLIVALLAWVAAGLILRGMRWAVIAGTVIGLIAFLYLAIPATRTGLLHPSLSLLHFDLLIAIFAFALLAVITGLTATLQGAARSPRSTPFWLRSLIIGMIGLVIGLIVLAAVVTANPQGGQAAATTNGIPTVHTQGDNFTTNAVVVPKGQRLMITNDDGEKHIIQNGSWDTNGTPHPQIEAGGPVVNNQDFKSGSFVIGPFTTAGVFHLYCPIHQGMNLTIVVQ